MEYIYLYAFIYVGASIVWGLLARRKGRSFLAFFALSVFVTPIIGMIVVILMPATETAKMSVETGSGLGSVGPVPCPYCKEQIRPDAVVCKHCGRDVEPAVNRLLAEHREAEKQKWSISNEARLVAETARVNRQKRWSAFWTMPKKITVSILGLLVVGVVLFLAIRGGAASVREKTDNLAELNKSAAPLLQQIDDWQALVTSCDYTKPSDPQLGLVVDSSSISFEIRSESWGGGKVSDGLGDHDWTIWISCLEQPLGVVYIDESKGGFAAIADPTSFHGTPLLTMILKDGGYEDPRGHYSVRVDKSADDTIWQVRLSKGDNFDVIEQNPYLVYP